MKKIIKLFTIPNLAKERIFGLDLLRFFAIFFVMYVHASYFLPFRDKVGLYLKFCYDGVGIFFVLSGFLIGSIIIKNLIKQNVSKKELIYFWKQRWSRTLPNYYLFLTLTIFYHLYFNKSNNIYDYFYYLLFLQGFIENSSLDFYHSWSLCVDEWFYFLIPLLLFLFLRLMLLKPRMVFLVTCIVVILFVTFLRLYIYVNNIEGNLNIIKNMRFSISTRLDALMYGMLAAYIKYYYPYFWKKSKVAGLLIGLIGAFLFYFLKSKSPFYDDIISYTLTSITMISFLPYLFFLRVRVKENKIARFITHISLISYSLYLVNNFFILVISLLPIWDDVNIFVSSYITKNSSWGVIMNVLFFLYWVVTFLLSTLTYKYFETPTMKFLRARIKLSKI